LVERIFSNRSYKNKDLPIVSLKQLRKAIKVLSPIRTLSNLNPSIYHHFVKNPEQIREWSILLHNEGEIVEIALQHLTK